ncbi:MAG: hypothetical protein Q9169_004844 [Polycauliona sp. 2 TL-2023]
MSDTIVFDSDRDVESNDDSDFDFDQDSVRYKICGQNKAPFAQERRRTEDGHLKEVVLALPNGKKPELSNAMPFEVLTARRWDEGHFFWTMDWGTEKYIMKAIGGSYRRCIKIDGNRKVICEKRKFAYPVPETVLETYRPRRSSSPTVSDSDVVPEHFMNQSPFQVERTMSSRKRRLSNDRDMVSVAGGPAVGTATVPTSPVEDILKRDRAYYGNRRPPYVPKLAAEPFIAVRVNEHGERTVDEIEVDVRQRSDGLQYWVVTLDGQE